LDAMKKLHMDASRVFITNATKTGVALIMVDEKTSQNKIVVIPGACETISNQEIDSLTDLIENSEYLLTQLETNISSVERIIEISYKNGVKVILNTAPVQPISDELLSKIHLITPNEVEAEILTGIPITGEQEASKAADWFLAKGVGNVIITLGNRGAYIADGKKRRLIPVPDVKVVDTTGAGDAFNGGLLAALAEGKDLWEAVLFANSLASISVQRIGTTPAMPTREEIDAFMAAHKLGRGRI